MRPILASVLVLLLSAAAAGAAEGDFARVRGTIEAASDRSLTVASREGPSVEIALLPGYAIAGVEGLAASDITVGDYVGVGSLPRPGEDDVALEVLIFPDSMEGTGEGSYPWDLQPGSVMTNATVRDIAEGPEGRVLTLSYPGGAKRIVVPPNVPVVTFVEAGRPDLTPGAAVFVPALENAEGRLQTDFVAVEIDGTVPPM